MAELMIYDDAERSVFESFTVGWPDQAGSTHTLRTVWKAGTAPDNEMKISAAIGQAIVDMAAVMTDCTNLLAQAAPGAGTLTAAQLSTVVRQLDTALRTVVTDLSTTAQRLKQAARLLNGDFSSST